MPRLLHLVLTNKPKLRIFMTEKELKGDKRFVVDGMASKRECKSLINLSKLFAIVGDGYQGNRSPHTVMEKFEGITLSRVLFLVYFRLVHPKYLDLFLMLTDKALNIVKEYFNIQQSLYFSYTHLVCRSALADSPRTRSDFSHKIHADNCIILENGTCIKTAPSYTWRDFSAILYLNDDFEGGEFVFSSGTTAKDIQSTVNPTCGRMVAFTSGGENLHGVKAVKKGSRCAVGIWFTYDSEKADKNRPLAYQVVEKNVFFDSFSPSSLRYKNQ